MMRVTSDGLLPDVARARRRCVVGARLTPASTSVTWPSSSTKAKRVDQVRAARSGCARPPARAGPPVSVATHRNLADGSRPPAGPTAGRQDAVAVASGRAIVSAAWSTTSRWSTWSATPRWSSWARSAADVPATVLAKVEYFNPGGSVKDRIALRMIEAAEAVRRAAARRHDRRADLRQHRRRAGASWPSSAGYHCVFVLPDKVRQDKINVLTAYGAEVEVCPTAVPPEDPRSYYSVSDRLVREIPGAWKPDQYSNPNNPRSHYETTGPSSGGRPTAGSPTSSPGVGTGGTISGTGRYLKEVSDGRVQVDRRRPGGLGLLRRHRPAVPRRGRRRGLLADRLRPRRSPTRSSRSATATRS